MVELYQVIRDEPKNFIRHLRKHAASHSKEYYYHIRAKKMRSPATRAAQFLYLNRTCWNGLYRENKNGQFNVPIGTKDIVIFPSDDFYAWSDLLQCADILSQDFERTIDDAREEDFLFIDPPYTVLHNLNGFIKYNQDIFAWQDQMRLKDALIRAAERGVNFAVTNADHESLRNLYNNIGHHKTLFRHSIIAGKASHRIKSTELLVTNWHC